MKTVLVALVVTGLLPAIAAAESYPGGVGTSVAGLPATTMTRDPRRLDMTVPLEPFSLSSQGSGTSAALQSEDGDGLLTIGNVGLYANDGRVDFQARMGATDFNLRVRPNRFRIGLEHDF